MQFPASHPNQIIKIAPKSDENNERISGYYSERFHTISPMGLTHRLFTFVNEQSGVHSVLEVMPWKISHLSNLGAVVFAESFFQRFFHSRQELILFCDHLVDGLYDRSVQILFVKGAGGTVHVALSLFQPAHAAPDRNLLTVNPPLGSAENVSNPFNILPSVLYCRLEICLCLLTIPSPLIPVESSGLAPHKSQT